MLPYEKHFAFNLLAALCALPGHLIQMFQLENTPFHSFSKELFIEDGGGPCQLL